MSSIKFDTSIGGEEIRKMTTQWGYTSLPGEKQPEATQRETGQVNRQARKTVARCANAFMHLLLMLAGGATGFAVLAGGVIVVKSWIS